MFGNPVVFFSDESEPAIIAEFVRFSALYPKHTAYDVAFHVFRNLREPESRATQAALLWSRDLAILERIRLARANGGNEPTPLTVEELQKKILEITEDNTVAAKDKSVMIEGYMAIARLNGWEKKPPVGGGAALSEVDSGDFLKSLSEMLPS